MEATEHCTASSEEQAAVQAWVVGFHWQSLNDAQDCAVVARAEQSCTHLPAAFTSQDARAAQTPAATVSP